MSFWKSMHRVPDPGGVAENLAHSPSGGPVKALLLSICLALLPVGYDVCCILSGHATFFGNRGARLELYGASATALAIGYIALGLFIHAHWFWGLHPKL